MHPPSVRRASKRAFALLDALTASVISVISLLAFYAASGQAIRLVKSGKQGAYASEVLQQRIETFRATSQWSNVTTSAGLISQMQPASAVAANFPGASESVKIEPYPAVAGTALVAARTAAGAVSASGPDLSAQLCVKLTLTVNWTASGGVARSRQLATIISKGGL